MYSALLLLGVAIAAAVLRTSQYFAFCLTTPTSRLHILVTTTPTPRAYVVLLHAARTRHAIVVVAVCALGALCVEARDLCCKQSASLLVQTVVMNMR
jgi:hypothetical protein